MHKPNSAAPFFITLITLVVLFIPCNAQDSLVRKFDIHRIKNPQEKIFLHIDRTGYVTGETMWFKVYCTNGSTHTLSNMSKVVYVEIISQNDVPVAQGKIELREGIGHGSFFLPATLENGNYTVRAYTSWMKNYRVEYFYHQEITILNPFRPPGDKPTVRTEMYDAQFMPEGGNLLLHTPSKVAFRVIDRNGKGISFKGALFSETGEHVADFAPSQFGIGTFEFTPRHSKHIARITDANNVSHEIAFPPVQAEGFSLRLEATTETVNIHITSTISDLTSPLVHLFVHARNQVIQSKSAFLKNGSITFTLDKNVFLEGINHITLFDSFQNPVCERLYFRIPTETMNVSLRTDNATFGRREKVKVSLSALGKNNQALNANLSMSVYRIDTIPYPRHQQMVSYFLLTSDLTGTVESPDYYFEQPSEAAFDELMLSHGWRRFSWAAITRPDTTKKNLFYPELQGLIVRGKVLDESGSAAKNIRTFFSRPSSTIRLSTSVSDDDGFITFALKDFYGSDKVILQTALNHDSVYKIELHDPFMNEHRELTRPLILDPGFEEEITSRSIGMQIEDIFRKDTLDNIDHGDTTSFYGTADETYYLDDFTRFPVMEEVMREYVKGVWVRKNQNGFYFKVLDNVTKSVFQEDPLVLLDGVPLFNIDRIMAFDPLKIRKLEVMTRLFFVGRVSFPGIVSYSTYTGDLGGFTLHPKSISIDFEGLQHKREFYHPKYETENEKNSREPDQRHLLLWQPEIRTVNGKAEIEFYTSDRSGTFQIDVHGISEDGRMGSRSWHIFVKPFEH